MRRALWLLPWLASACTAGADPPLVAEAAVTAEAESPAAPAPSGYFPSRFATTRIACDPAGLGGQMAILSEFQQGWYSRHLAAAGEPSLHAASLEPRERGSSILRFTWLRTSHAPVIVRVETDQGRHGRLVAKRLSGAGGHAPGNVEQRLERPLTAAEAERLRAALERSRLFALPPQDCSLGFDGSQWIFESVDSDGYHFLDRWTPRSGPPRRVGELMLALTGWKVDPIY